MKSNTHIMEPLDQKNNGRVFTGIILIAAGLLILAYKMGAPIPEWLISWRLALIVIGVIISIRSKLRGPAGPILIVVGLFHVIDRYMPELNIRTYIFPIIIIVVGLFFIFRPRHGWKGRRNRMNRYNEAGTNEWPTNQQNDMPVRFEERDFIDTTAVLGGVKKIMVSKNFRGGEITCFMGGAEIDLTQADIQGEASLDITTVFGGCKLIVPGHWEIKSEMTVVFGGIDDKRSINANNINPSKVLILEGTAVFGGIDIRSY
ncbi:hypothetical protein EXU57_18465 [Segetibacter sp. 3557_3]|uniref:LiaF transmembrane domain-containing protein n=1 Tax=Segetibacter sp. 3557_3 TaxID=2547429 RepID=UPI001058FCE0|nr:LiaF domain-containing protein [Segetibacter sp. 3557_3]TDH23042.1 hypothetical protein EXU57_18465 [Segetibacter sp. 3557_3]